MKTNQRITFSFLYFLVPFLDRVQLWMGRLGVLFEEIGICKYFYSGLTLQFSPTSIIVIIIFNMTYVIFK